MLRGNKTEFELIYPPLLLRVTGSSCYSNHVCLRCKQPLEQIKYVAAMSSFKKKKEKLYKCFKYAITAQVHLYSHTGDFQL